MKERLSAYLPRDRLMALEKGDSLPSRTTGSVLFADISGFTPLTEAYELHLGARSGGEELTRILNEVYTVLIGEVDRVRGSVIGFAGDAITCWFEGDDGRRAIAAGLAMQRDMKRFQAIPSPSGEPMALGLKAAATTGDVKRFIVGDEAIQRVDVLAGDPVYRVALAEQMANRGELVIDSATRNLLGPALKITEQREDKEEPFVAYVVESMDLDVSIDPWPEISNHSLPDEVVEHWMIDDVRERIQSGHSDFFTELRPATAVFIKFGGIDFDEDHEADEKLDTFFSMIQQIVARYEGVVHQLTLGDKGSFLYAAFGAPISHEDDTRRAFAASAEIRDRTQALKFITTIQTGIGRGTTRTGAYGGPTRRTYGVLGDQVNLAARLMGKASSGQILVSENAAREGMKSFELKQLHPIRVKGKSNPIDVYEVLRPVENRRQARNAGYSLPMVGRLEELTRIKQFAMEASEGHGQVVSIVADPGMGKSRLVSEALIDIEARGFRIFHGECQTFGNNTLYTPWWEIWRDFFAISSDLSAQEIEDSLKQRLSQIDANLALRYPVLGPVLNVDLPDNELTGTFDAKLKRTSLESLLVDCLRAETSSHPVAIVLEDVQSIDAVSRDLLCSLVQAVARLPILIVLAHRPVPQGHALSSDEEGLDYSHQLILREFSEAESAELIRLKFAQLLGHEEAIPAGVIRQITQRTGGNPFFIDEVMNWMQHHDIDILSEAALTRADLPVSLHALVLSRMDQLDADSRVTMKVASVVGRFFQAAILWGVYPDLGGKDPVLQSLEVLSQNDFTEREEKDAEFAYLFKHVVIHEVAYESLPNQLRKRLHESIGQYIESTISDMTTKVLDLLAFHYGRSPNKEKKREYFLKAGHAARKAYANKAAEDYYEAVLPILEEKDQVPVLRHLGQVKEISGDWQGAMETYQSALQMAAKLNNIEDMAHCHLDIGDLHRKMGSLEEASEFLTKAQSEFKKMGDEEGIGQALHSRGTVAAQSGDFDNAKDLYNKSIDIRRKLGDDLKVSSLLGNTGIILRFQGKDKEALEHQELSLEMRKAINDPWFLGNSYNNLGMMKRYMGDYQGAQVDLEAALKYFERVGDRAEKANTLTSLAELAIEQRNTEACDQYLQESLRLLRELGNKQGLAYLLEAFAMNAWHRDRHARCLRLIGAARSLRESIGAPLPEPEEEKIKETIQKISEAYPKMDIESRIREGETLPISTALDFAAGLEDSDL